MCYRLTSIRDAVKGKVNLVLHGRTGDLEVHESIRHGITKVNLNGHLAVWNGYMSTKTSFLPVTGLMDGSIDIMQTEIERLCDLCASSGKA